MAIKYREAEDLRMTTRQELTSSPENWLKFLRTASNTYKYNFSDQLLIFAQFPNAKAVAVFDVWSKTFGRKIREGEKGIGLIDDKGEYPRIKYVFDISQSSPTQPKKQQPYIWELTEENHQEVAFLLSSDKNKSIENVLADTVENTVDEMIDDYINDLLNEDSSIEPEKFRQLVCDSVKYMALQRCGLDTSSYIDGDIFSNLNEFSNPDVIDILGESISNISEQALRKVEQTVKTIERRNQNERNNAQNKNDRWSRTSSVRVEHDILSNDNSGQDNWSKLHTRPGNIHIPSSSERRGRYEGRGSLGATSPQVSQRKQEKNIDKANRHTQTDRPLDRSQRSSGETDGTARSGNDGSRGSNRRTQSNRPDEVGTNDELNQSKSRGNSSEQSDIRITQENTVTQTAEDNSPAVFSFEQIGFFDSKTEQQSEVDKFVNAVLMKGTGTEDGKFRVNDFFSENHTEKEKIDFLKDEFGWYGRYTSSESLESQPSKGLTLTRTDKENPENNLNIHLSWKEVVEHLDSMVSGKTYITEKDIAERQRHALYVLKNYSSDNPNDVYAIQKAKETLDSYNIDYSDIISPALSEKSVIHSSIDYSKDLFFLNENSEIVTLLQYNPDSDLGGQFVSTNVRYNQIQEAAQKFGNSTEEFFNYIVSVGQQYLSDIGTDLYNADLEKYSSNAHNFEGLTPETMAQLVNITKNNEIYKSDTYPTITCEWSESPAFEDGKTYTVAEFDSIMKQADDDWVKRRQYEIDTYGDDIDKIYEAFEKGEIENVHQGYAKTKFNVNMPDGTVHTFRQDIGDGDGGVIDFLKQYPQYSEVVRILEADIYLENHSDELLKPTLAFDEEVAITDEFFDFEKAWHNVDSGIPEIAERYRNGEDISIDLAKYFTNHYVNLNNFNDYGKFEIHSDDNEVTIQNGEISKSYSWNELGEHYLSYLKDTFISIQTERVSEYPETKDEVEKLITSVKAEQKSENKTAKSNEKTFAEQVDEALSGKIPFYSSLKVCNTPKILVDIGCKQLPMLYTQKHLRDALHEKSSKNPHWHGLTVEKIKNLPVLLQEPVIVFDSLTRDDSVMMVLSESDNDNLPLIVSIKPNGQGRYNLEQIDSNFITSIYGKDNFLRYIENIIKKDKLLFISKEKSQKLFERWGLQLPELTKSFGFDTIIHQSRNIVNENIVEGKYTSTQSEEKETIQIKPENYHISDLFLGQRKPLEKYQDNITAIKTLKQLEAENRNATPEEQEILSKYTGWGGMAKVFELGNSHYDEVKGLLTNDEYAAARKSAMSAFYTSPVIIKEIYSKLSDMGFSKGKLLEPSCGVGNFIGMIPQDMQAKITGIELDSLTGRIAKKLYPEAQIQICGFENSNLKSESFDVAVGNVPFGDIRVYDKKYNKENLLIHDYFFSKSLDMVKPGGVVAFITSKGTLDKRNDTARRLLAEKAEFLGAVRLPNNAFKANAGTEVTSDIIFLQKRTEPIKITSEDEPSWLKTEEDESGIEMNSYFVQNPQQICGHMEMVSGQFGMESTCVPNRDTKLSEQIRNAMENIQGNISTKDTKLDNVDFVDEQVEIPDSLRTGSYFLSSDKVYFFEYGTATEVKLPKSNRKQNLERMAGLIAIRDTVRQLLEMQLDDKVTDDEIKDVQSVLSSLYDDFASKYGRINDDVNKSIFKNDSSLPLLRSLEKFDKDKYVGKADIFTKRTVNAYKRITSVPTAVDALAVSLSDTAKVNLEYMSKLTGLDKEKLIEDLQGSIYHIPNTDKYVTSDEYLSGNILKKLEEAQNAFDKGDSSLAINIQALEKAMPEKIQASDIDVRLGATWINPKYIKDFVYELLGTALYHKNPIFKKDFIDVQYSELTGKWYITNKSSDKNNVQAIVTYGTKDRTAYELIEDMLNLKATQVKSAQVVDGKEKLVVDNKKTAQVRAKQEIIQQKFQEWIFSDKTRRDDIVDTYNRIFNVNRPREYDGKYLNFVGMNPEIQLRQHQLNAVARCLYGGNTLLAHEVGAGKTFEMIAAAMEGKRLGLHTKSLMCVPNHLTEQMGEDFLKLYPNANILVAKKKDFIGDARRALMAKIATGNYDAVIIGHSQLAKIPLSAENQERFIQNQIDELIKNIAEMKAHNGQNFQVKQAERTKANLEARLKKLLDTKKDDTVTFEELGVDKLFLDEAHYFKNLFLSTKMTNVSGIATSDNVEKTADLYMKTQYLDEITNGKGLVFATGTPVSNTICEIYNMMKYLQSDLLKEKNLWHFDSWASTFGESVTQMELAPEGNTYRAKTRFAKFHNLPELMNLFKECADIQTADTLNLPNIPDCEIHNVSCEPTEIQKQLVEALAKRAVKIHNHEVDPHEDNMPKITTDGRKIGLDQRLINPDLPDEPGTKVNACVDNVFRIWNETKEEKSTQLIFCDYSTPKKDGSFNVYDDIKRKLISKGISTDEIAFIHDATTEAAKEELFAKVRSGEVRVLIGSTAKMGAGTNVQTKLVASHDLDAPFRPADMEQRRGRMVRQGNENKQVHLYRYCTKDTFDAYLFQMLERKQKFISQIMTSKSPQRRCDDVDEATLSYAEVKALCVGDPRIKEKMELDNEVAKLILERSGYQQEQYRLEDMAASLTSKIEILENVIPKNQNDFLYYHKNYSVSEGDKKTFAGISINGQQYTKKDEAAEALKQAYIKACSDGNNKYTPIGEYKGFEVAVMFDCFSREYKASLTREGTYYLDLGTDNFTRMDNVLEKLENTCKERIERLSEHKKSLKETNEQIGKPFYKENEYQSKTAKLAKLNAELDVDGRKDNIADIEDTKEVSQNIVQKR
ncbi:MAG: LPD25 domain-containing protein [Candidatus Pseudoruminococcus sp.]|nr:DEAD/DEAH box helicase family protein [Ruminococcus sp.]MDY2783536.1 LPD25 domain-containing protein [Candidatus Pseudoruminococcus sp.]